MRRRKALYGALALAALAAGVASFWLLLWGAEQLLARKGAGDAGGPDRETAGTLEEQPEPLGTLKLYGTAYTYDHEMESWLIIGTDGRGSGTPGSADYRGDMADFLLLAVFDKTDDTYAFLQLDRDTIAKVDLMLPDGTANASAREQICTAHGYGGNPEDGCVNTVNAVSRLLGGIPIEGYYSISIGHIPQLNHAVGGVEVTIRDDFSELDPTLKMGETILLNDTQARNYVQGRMQVGDGTNTGRMARQREYMQGFFNKVMERTEEDSAFLGKLYQEMADYAVASMTGRDLSRIMKRAREDENRGVFQIEGTHTVGKLLWDKEEHMQFYPDEDSVREVMAELYHLEEAGP